MRLYFIAFVVGFLVFSQLVRADSLTLYAYRSPSPLNWKTPTTLTRSVIQNSLPKLPSLDAPFHAIGHINIQIQCDAWGGFPGIDIFSGMTTELETEERDLLLNQDYGLGILFHDFKGKLMERNRVRKITQSLLWTGRVAFMIFEIQPETCRRLEDYFNEFILNGYDAHYGLPNRPRRGEGAGCSAFGTSFLEVGGLMEPEYIKNWKQQIRVPMKYVGGPMTGQRVTISSLLFPDQATAWATELEAFEEVDFWDPDLIHRWINETYDREKSRKRTDYQFLKWGKTKGLLLDRRDRPTPTDSLFY